MKRRYWLIIAATLLVAVLGHPLYLLLFTWGANPLTVSEITLEADSPANQILRVTGTIEPGSIDWDDGKLVLRFRLTDGRESLSVHYAGTAPESFRPGNELTIEGRFGADGVYRADNLNSSRPVCIVCH